MFSKVFVVTSLALLAFGNPAATKTKAAATQIFTVAVPLGLGPKNAIFNAGIIGKGAAGTTITYALAEDVLETVTATINSKSLVEVQEGETQICTLTKSAKSVLCTHDPTKSPFLVTHPLTTVPIPGPTLK
ncbi:hypothetical protein K438DRAFT_2027337 [Mycena galopus ATCC 62051]|nr:hypothetical protein K438DRAFT_1945200 [Mycena galopus ATCC 62051]KAF8149732.1 hypothetical protein K438DRAFT_2027337 [Mycena galopus ATCC 62051]